MYKNSLARGRPFASLYRRPCVAAASCCTNDFNNTGHAEAQNDALLLQIPEEELNKKVNETCDGNSEDSLTCAVKYYCKYDVNVNSSDWCLPICYYQSRDSSTVCCEGRDPLCTVEHEMCAITAPGTQPGQYVCRYDMIVACTNIRLIDLS